MDRPDGIRQGMWMAGLLVAAVGVAACGSSSSSSDGSGGSSGAGAGGAAGSGGVGVGGGSSSSASAFFSTFCKLDMVCCTLAGMSNNPSHCESSLTQNAPNGAFNSAVAAECLSEMQAFTSDGTACPTDIPRMPACSNMYLFLPNGTVQPGGSCASSYDCAPASGGTADCVSSKCVGELPGKLGDGPCYGTIVNGLAESSSTPDTPSTIGYLCDHDGTPSTYCSTVTHKCTAAAAIGASCGDFHNCVSGAFCDQDATCKPVQPLGGTCDLGFEFGCVPDTYCDGTTNLCKTPKADGESCNDSGQCKSRFCSSGGKCVGGGPTNLCSK